MSAGLPQPALPTGENASSASLRGSSSRAASLSLHIERLVLDGVALTPAQGEQLQLAMRQELERLAQRRMGPRQGGAVPVVAAPALTLSNPLRPARLGRDIARSLYGSLRRLP